ncbi:alkyl hydroperoxide reductase AhpD [Advenella faeciporci]|uniref:Alkyl hydroperoxide reductase AhpD n=1 Tax=Advenella faeciporci TaxID=797535 RepID=A0A918N149_9BURK|nr:carboxymuconolactone decarboxylase family protein [Advenella faeciporci]GGW92199.1 alkyl hydroperoxide reductase AhpD [Advenella faeciporci]
MSRLDYFSHNPELAQKYLNFSQTINSKPSLEKIKELVTLRASQINGCAFCVDMHVKEAKINGERELCLHHVAIWRESPLFDERERAALEWTEALTTLPPEGVSDEIYLRVREQFPEDDIVALTFLIVSINGWNRLSIAFKSIPGSVDKAFGLDKAGLF